MFESLKGTNIYVFLPHWLLPERNPVVDCCWRIKNKWVQVSLLLQLPVSSANYVIWIVWPYFVFLIYSFVHSAACPLQAGASPSWRWARAGYTVDPSPVHHRADIQRQTTVHVHIHTQTGNLETPVKLTCPSLDCRKREPTQTQDEHVNSTQKGPASAGYQTQVLFAIMGHCWPLSYRDAWLILIWLNLSNLIKFTFSLAFI